MADRHLPMVPSPAPGSSVRTSALKTNLRSGAERERDSREPIGSGAGDGSGAEGPRRPARPTLAALAVGSALLAGGLILALGVAALVGDAVRGAVLVEVDRSPRSAQPSHSDAPAEAAAFFARRDTVQVRVPRDMTLADFLSLYHLETNLSARAALREQLGVVAEGDVLREGERVTLTITVPRVGR